MKRCVGGGRAEGGLTISKRLRRFELSRLAVSVHDWLSWYETMTSDASDNQMTAVSWWSASNCNTAASSAIHHYVTVSNQPAPWQLVVEMSLPEPTPKQNLWDCHDGICQSLQRSQTIYRSSKPNAWMHIALHIGTVCVRYFAELFWVAADYQSSSFIFFCSTYVEPHVYYRW